MQLANDESHFAFFVSKGSIKILRNVNDQPLILRAGAFIGEPNSLLKNAKTIYNIIANEETTIFLIDKEDYK